MHKKEIFHNIKSCIFSPPCFWGNNPSSQNHRWFAVIHVKACKNPVVSEVFYCLVFAGGKQIDSKKACFVSSNSFWSAVILFVWLIHHQNDLKKKCMYAGHDMKVLHLEILVVRPPCLYSSHELWLNIRRVDRLTWAICWLSAPPFWGWIVNWLITHCTFGTVNIRNEDAVPFPMLKKPH